MTPDSSRLLVYGEVALYLWNALGEGVDGQTLADALVTTYGIARTTAERDLAALLANWESEGLIADHSPAPAVVLPAEDAAASEMPPGLAPRYYRIRDLAFAICSDDPRTGARLDSLLAEFSTVPLTPAFVLAAWKRDDTFHLTRDGAALIATKQPEEIIGTAFFVILEGLYPGLRWLATLHGCAVARGDRALIIAGPAGAGKSTLAAYLAASGFEFLSDDLVAIANGGDVVPWPVAVSIKEGSWDVLAPHLPALNDAPIAELGTRRMKHVAMARSRSRANPVEAGALIFVAYRAGSAPSVQRVAPLEALVRLMTDRLWLDFPLDEERVSRFVAWLGALPTFALSYASFDQIEPMIAQVLG